MHLFVHKLQYGYHDSAKNKNNCLKFPSVFCCIVLINCNSAAVAPE